MKIFSTNNGKIIALFACVMLLAVSGFAQSSLNKALNTDSDNKADFTVFRTSNNTWYTLKSDGSGFTFQQFGAANTDYPTPGDYDGDNKGDISVWRDTDGAWYRLNSSNNAFVATQFGATGDEPVARDYDGDGKFDIAVQRPGATATSQSTFFILKSSDSAVQAIAFGLSNDYVVPGDYDGDGKTDIAVVREGATANSNLFWYILRSSNGTLLSYSFGITGSDLSTQGDYDGDGKTDVAIWRDTNGTFYAIKSSDGGVISQQWGASNDYPIASYDTH